MFGMTDVLSSSSKDQDTENPLRPRAAQSASDKCFTPVIARTSRGCQGRGGDPDSAICCTLDGAGTTSREPHERDGAAPRIESITTDEGLDPPIPIYLEDMTLKKVGIDGSS